MRIYSSNGYRTLYETRMVAAMIRDIFFIHKCYKNARLLQLNSQKIFSFANITLHKAIIITAEISKLIKVFHEYKNIFIENKLY